MVLKFRELPNFLGIITKFQEITQIKNSREFFKIQGNSKIPEGGSGNTKNTNTKGRQYMNPRTWGGLQQVILVAPHINAEVGPYFRSVGPAYRQILDTFASFLRCP